MTDTREDRMIKDEFRCPGCGDPLPVDLPFGWVGADRVCQTCARKFRALDTVRGETDLFFLA